MSWVGTAVAAYGAYNSAETAKSEGAANRAAGDRAAEAAKFNPYGVEGGAFGNVDFSGNQANLNLSPEMQALQNQYGLEASQFARQGQTGQGAQASALGQDFLGGLQADPFAGAQTQFNQMDSILSAGRDRQRGALEERLLRQGRLGSTGGSLQQQGLEGAIEESRQKGLYDALQQSQGIQNQQAQLGQGMTLFGQQQANQGFEQSQARLGGIGALDQSLLGYAGLGSDLGGRASSAGAAAGQFSTQGQALSSMANLGAAQGQNAAFGQLGGAISGYDWGGSSSPYNADTGGGTLAAKTDDQWANNWDY